MSLDIDQLFNLPRREARPPRRRWWLWLLAGIAAVYLVRALAYLVTEWRWFASLDQEAVLRLRLLAPVAVWAVAALAIGLFLAANWLWAARRAAATAVWPGQRPPLAAGPRARRAIVFATCLTAALLAVRAATHWSTVWLYARRTAFGQTDPVFGRDVSFYVFDLPFAQLLIGAGAAALVAAAIGVVAIYVASGMLDVRLYASAQGVRELSKRASGLPASVRSHLWLLAGVAAALVAAELWLSRYELLFSARTGRSFYGPGFVDVTARLPAYQILAGLALVAAVAFVLTSVRGRWWWPLAIVGTTALVGFAALVVWPAIVQQYRVKPNELSLERPYIANSIAMTRQAYRLDGMAEAEYDPNGILTKAVAERNKVTVGNVRLWDWRSLLATFRQLQVIRTYYDFPDVDIDRYPLESGPRQVELALRELVSYNLQNPTWVNRHLEFTHGFGAVVTPVDRVDAAGLPVLWVRDIPPVTVAPFDRTISQPRVYFGEAPDDSYVIVRTSTDEFDYPSSDGNVRTRYEGADGVPIGGFMDRLLFALRFGDSEILFASGLTNESRVLMHRRLTDRLSALAPFLTFDPDPYSVITSDGRIVWIADAYTLTDRYPYAQPVVADGMNYGDAAYASLAGHNYVRNSVKVVVDAYDGTTTFYVVDASDPLVATLRRVFPGLFRDADEMPAELLAHWRYPEGLFRAQAEIIGRFHMVDPETFYNAEDLWQVPTQTSGGENRLPLQPYYVTMRLRGETRDEFLLMLPYTPAQKQNMIAWLAARCDPGHYGELVLYRFSKGRLVLGPQQIDSRIDQDPTISAQFTLWSQRGSQVIRGNLLVIPIEDCILYVEPVYIQAEASALPQLSQVVVATGERVVMRPTLPDAVAMLFTTESLARTSTADGGRPAAAPGAESSREQARPTSSTPSETMPTDVAGLVLEARNREAAAQRALQSGDWEAFGREMAAMRTALDRLGTIVSTPAPAAGTPTAAAP